MFKMRDNNILLSLFIYFIVSLHHAKCDISTKPRITTIDGNLRFEASNKDILFMTSENGKVKINNNDVSSMFDQVNANKADIVDIQNSGTGGTVPPGLLTDVQTNKDTIATLQSQSNDHTSRIETLEEQNSALDESVQQIQTGLASKSCASNPCINGGTCVELYDDFYCICPDQYEGEKCGTNHNECDDFKRLGGGCQNGGTCQDTIGSFQCNCPSDFYGWLCTSRYDDCTDGNAKCNHGICVNTGRDDPDQPKFTCDCDDGWTNLNPSNPVCSENINECLDSPCSTDPFVHCYDTAGSYTCGSCPSGYSGSGWSCSDINECAENNGGCSTSPMVQCVNTQGSYTCGPCPPGYSGNGRTCTSVGPCTSNNGGCHSLATCTANTAVGGNAVICTCPNGYFGNGIGPFGCTLVSSDCTTSCQNGECNSVGSVQVCICDAGWTSANCDVNIDECASSPCLNDGSCFDGVNGFICQCMDGFYGDMCQFEVGECGSVQESNSGSVTFPKVTGQTYPNNFECDWKVLVSLGKIIKLSFPVLDIEGHETCVFDYVEVFDGPNDQGVSLGKFCNGNEPPLPLVTSHNQAFVVFRADADGAGNGFQMNWIIDDPTCGGDVSDLDHGTVSSPGWPGKYPGAQDCYWTISVVPGNVIQVLFGTLGMEAHANCSYDFLEIRDGLSETDPVLVRYCTTTNLPPLLSSSNYLFLHFHSDNFMNDVGFHLTWSSQPISIAGCGDYFTDDEGVFISPNFPYNYDPNEVCTWWIHIRDGGEIELTFTDFDLETRDTCDRDFVKIHDGKNELAPFVGQYCGKSIPPVYTSSSNDLWVQFRSDFNAEFTGFRASYNVACGGTYTATSGTLDSPYYPEAYPNNKDCYYLIRQPPGYNIRLEFTDFEVEDGENCAYDYVEVRDGSSEDAPLLAKVCGPSLAPPIISSQNFLWVHFSTDNFVGGSGFQATYSADNTGCGGVYTSSVGSLQSPGHPSAYPHGVKCTYNIMVDPALIIHLQFLAFGLETSDNCTKDSVAIYDGLDNTSPSLGRFCGSVLPPPILSSSNIMTIVFTTDDAANAEGFAAAYATRNASTACGRRITDSEGVITSPEYPNNYPDQRTCEWTLTVPEGSQILVTFTDFEFEKGNSEGTCSYDYLELRNGGYFSSPLIGQFCGINKPALFISHSNQIYMKMVTDEHTNGRGFVMTYESAQTGCGGTLTSSYGAFQSPNYPYQYNHNGECTWLINVAAGSIIRLIFINFDVESHGTCDYDYVQAFDGSTTGHRSLGKVCGTRIPEAFVSSSNNMLVRFRSDSSFGGMGFLAQYYTDCDQTISDISSGLIQSPNWPAAYPPNRHCIWKIMGTRGNKINVTFNTFELDSCEDCACDFLKIYDGDEKEEQLRGKYCGFTTPGIFQTSGNYLRLEFFSNAYNLYRGFSMAWAADTCGAIITDTSGTITSPNYPNPYNSNQDCIWHLTAAIGKSIQLTITDFDVEHHTECVFDVVRVYSGQEITDDFLLSELCNADDPPVLPLVVSSMGRFMTVFFSADYSVQRKGFSANYEQLDAVCGGEIALPSGQIHSPLYPDTYPSNSDCEWYIDVGTEGTVLMTFLSVDVEDHENCTYDYIKVYDGYEFNEESLLLTACGHTIPPIVQSSTSKLSVHFHSDPFVGHSGFLANFEANCGGIIQTVITGNGEITSPGYPGNYLADRNCTWTVYSSKTKGEVYIYFTHMDIYLNQNTEEPCSNDYLQVLDGDNSLSPERMKICGHSLPLPFISTGNALTFNFVSKSIYQRSGFRLLYSSSTSACGGELTARSGYFTSPNYPEYYPPATTCEWTIKASPGNRIALTFIAFEMEDHGFCHYDFLDVREGGPTGTRIAKLCGSLAPGNITTVDGHILYIKFYSDSSTTAKGFQAYYEHKYGSTTIGKFEGEIASPLYPNHYPSEMDVSYFVYVPGNRNIQYSFKAFSLEAATEEGCLYDYVEIYDGDTRDSHVLDRLCGYFYYRPPRSTTQSAMLVFFHSDWGLFSTGFLLQWQASEDSNIPPNPTNVPTVEPGACGADHIIAALYPLTLYSPGYPGIYPDGQDCQYIIEAANGYSVKFIVEMIDTERVDNVCMDYLAVYEGREISTSSEIDRFCGKILPEEPIVSRGSFLSVRFYSDASQTRFGFKATYQQNCGGIIQSNQGVLESPNYPRDYPANTECSWKIQAIIGFTISLEFDNEFEMINSDSGNCTNGDYVQLRNGDDSNSPPLQPDGGLNDGKYCGTTPPSGLVTGGNGLYVTFHADDQNAGKGFRLTFIAAGTGCGGNLVLSEDIDAGTFSSPNYPSTYPDGADCIWIITAPSGRAVQIDFTDFNIEDHSRCAYDYVAIYEGTTANSWLLGKFCGSDKPPTVKSIGNTVLVRFRTDTTQGTGGFQARYSIASCGGTAVGSSGVISSPNFPWTYSSPASCEWEIRGPKYHFLSLRFTSFNLAGNSNCDDESDYVEFRTTNYSGPVVGKYCGTTLPSSIDTEENVIFMKFVAVGSESNTGFSLTFTASEDACGGEMTTPAGSLFSPNYPSHYDHQRICEWLITVSNDRRVTLTFHDFQIEQPNKDGVCVYDYVLVYNGIYSTSPIVSSSPDTGNRYCGNTLPSDIDSTGNTMRVLFRTDGTGSGTGFLATYTSTEPRICGGSIQISSGSGKLQSPNFPDNYPGSAECVWVIDNQNGVNSSIKFSFNTFDLEDHQTCDYDVLRFKAGSDNAGYNYITECGNHIPPAFAVAFPETFIQFTSDPFGSGKGFEVTYEVKPCGGIIFATTSGVITSPNYPQAYNINDFCLWTLVAIPGHRIKLHWNGTFDIEAHPNCDYDYMKIYNGPTIDSPLVGTYCRTNTPPDFTSGSEFITILFQSDWSENGVGWKLNWEVDEVGCGNIMFHGHSGSFTSPKHPDNYPLNTQCDWTIISDPAYHIDIEFEEDFKLEFNPQCLTDYVQISDKQSELNKFCGTYDGSNGPNGEVTESNQYMMFIKFVSDHSNTFRGFKANWEAHCGIMISDNNGVIQSPNYPLAYPNYEDCVYNLTYPNVQMFIKLEFTFLDLEAGSSVTECDYDYVAVYGNGANYDSDVLIGRYCGNTLPDRPLSSSESMAVVFHSDALSVDYGFQATYAASECGGHRTGPSGKIDAFTHNSFHNNHNCTWVIEVADVKVVEVIFTNFDLEFDIMCRYDYVKIYDGPDATSPVLETFCGSFTKDYVRSSKNQMTIEFITDNFVTGEGFSASYIETAGPLEGCGGAITSGSGEISSIDLDSSGSYDSNLNCIWLFQAEPNKIVKIEFTGDFQLENGTDAGFCYDKVEIRDGISFLDPIGLEACGIFRPSDYYSSGNYLVFRFFSDNFVGGTGFTAKYSFVNTVCGGTEDVTSSSKQFNYPIPSGRRNCRYIFDAGVDVEKYILISITKLDMQSTANSDGLCDKSFVEIRDYQLDNIHGSEQAVRYCNNNSPQNDFHSFGQTVLVLISTANGDTGDGLSLTYKTTGCTRDINGDFGQIFSPNWPLNYPHNSDCVVTVTVTSGYQIQLFFNYFDVEAEDSCYFDYLEVRDGDSATSDVLQKVCGTSIPNPIFPTGNSMRLRLVSDDGSNGKGYDITYSSSPDGCGGNFTGNHGSMTSFGYPQPYLPNQECSYLIQVPVGSLVTVHIRNLNIYYIVDDEGARCGDDILRLWGAANFNSGYIAGYCGQGVVTDRKSQNNYMFIRFLTGDFTVGDRSNTGFRLEYES